MNCAQIKKTTYYVISICSLLIVHATNTKIDFVSPPFTQTIGALLMDNIASIQMIFYEISHLTSQQQSTEQYKDTIDILIARFVRMQIALFSAIKQQAISTEDIAYIHQFVLDSQSKIKNMPIPSDQQEALRSVVKNVLKITI